MADYPDGGTIRRKPANKASEDGELTPTKERMSGIVSSAEISDTIKRKVNLQRNESNASSLPPPPSPTEMMSKLTVNKVSGSIER